MSLVTRERVVSEGGGVSSFRQRVYTIPSHTLANDTTIATSGKWKGLQVTTSEGHAFLSSRKKGMTDLGGPFGTSLREIEAPVGNYSSGSVVRSGLLYENVFRGYCLAVDPASANPNHPSAISDTALGNLGATAIARVAPLNPIAQATVALIELRNDGIPLIPGAATWQDRTDLARKAGEEYLNVEFGWLPLLNDILQISKGLVSSGDVLKQLYKDVGRNVRRRYDFPTQKSSTTTTASGRLPAVAAASSLFSPGTLTQETKVETRRWFSGCFTYYIPDNLAGSKKLAELAVLAEQLGLDPTPEAVWKATPWSWAVDWFSNTGDVISNWTRFHNDGLVMRYGYMMETTIYETRYSIACTAKEPGIPDPADVIVRTTYKKRVPANPYGFGLTYDGLSAFQKSILLAIGITHSK